MKKHDEGYVLAYVTVVLLIFCLVATTILTGAFRSLQAQQNANQQMKDRYMAQGQIEKILGKWGKWDFTPGATIIDDGENGIVICESNENGTITLSATCGTVRITCKLDGDGNYTYYEVGTNSSTGSEEVQE